MSHPSRPLLVDIDDLSWIAGFWTGYNGDDEVEEFWTLPKGGAMQGMFRWFRDGKVRLSEAIIIAALEREIRMRLKHFDAALKGWEAQDETVDFVLVEATATRAVFKRDGDDEWLVYERDGDRLTVRFERDGGPPCVTLPFNYQLVSFG